jgi:hypothetical protein
MIYQSGIHILPENGHFHLSTIKENHRLSSSHLPGKNNIRSYPLKKARQPKAHKPVLKVLRNSTPVSSFPSDHTTVNNVIDVIDLHAFIGKGNLEHGVVKFYLIYLNLHNHRLSS